MTLVFFAELESKLSKFSVVGSEVLLISLGADRLLVATAMVIIIY
jgi:hypothetical protein